ncbi:MAG: 50S ribosomal protein L18 [Nanoarchaeota archaeon]|nr:50S ribosomal protein L18 [Nanoarchaeota archaeon]
MFRIQHKRRRERKTNLRKRLNLVKSGKTRMVVRKTLSSTKIQFVNYSNEGDKTVASAISQELKKLGWTHSLKCLPAAYLTGLLAGKKAKEKGVTNAILDLGLQTSTKGSRIYAALKGVVDSGVNIPHSEEILPSQERLSGKHIDEKVVKSFEEIKAKIMG